MPLDFVFFDCASTTFESVAVMQQFGRFWERSGTPKTAPEMT